MTRDVIEKAYEKARAAVLSGFPFMTPAERDIAEATRRARDRVQRELDEANETAEEVQEELKRLSKYASRTHEELQNENYALRKELEAMKRSFHSGAHENTKAKMDLFRIIGLLKSEGYVK